MDNTNVIASSLASNELALAFSELVADRWDNWDLSPFMAYLVDICAPTALPFLADQFDVGGLQGFAMAADEKQQRDIIKRSIALHKYIGTPWAIREACRTVGFPVIVLEEGITAVPGGESSPEDWARFRVLIDIDNARSINAELAQKIRTFIEFYKNERSHLVDCGFAQLLTDNLDVDEDMDLMQVVVNPNPAILNRIGEKVIVNVTASVPWQIERATYEWEDGSGDRFTLNCNAGAADISTEIEIISDFNATGIREKTIEIRAVNGTVLGELTVRQIINLSAYSNAYSTAYNN